MIGAYWFQLLPGEEASVTFGPEQERVVIKLEDFEAEGAPDAKVSLDNEKDLVIRLLHMKKINQWGTIHPVRLGIVGGREIVASLIATPFTPSLLVNFALYDGPAPQKETSPEKGGAGGE